MKKLGKFFLNGILLTTCSVLMRTVAVSFNIYVAQKAGAEAMGLYSLLTGIYGFALTMALSGLHLAVTKLVAEALALDHRAAALKIVRHALFYAALFGVAAMTLLHFSAELIAERWLHDLRAQRPLKLLSLTLPLISASSVINGYFSAVYIPKSCRQARYCRFAAPGRADKSCHLALFCYKRYILQNFLRTVIRKSDMVKDNIKALVIESLAPLLRWAVHNLVHSFYIAVRRDNRREIL